MSLTLLLVIVTGLISILAFRNEVILDKLLLWPFEMKEGYGTYRLLTAGFVHANYTHLAFNMITFYFFGGELENFLRQSFNGSLIGGGALFLLLYLGGIVVSCVPSWIKKRNDPNYRSLGASGGVASVIFAFIYLQPWSKIYLFFAIGIPSILFAVLYLGYSAYMAKTGKGVVNHDAHFWGAVFGIIFMLFIDPSHGADFIMALKHP